VTVVVSDADLFTDERWEKPVLELDRSFFSIAFDHISYTVVARDRAHALELMPEIVMAQYGGDTSYAELLGNGADAPDIREIPGETNIWDDGRDGKQHPINTYPLGTWASSEY